MEEVPLHSSRRQRETSPPAPWHSRPEPHTSKPTTEAFERPSRRGSSHNLTWCQGTCDISHCKPVTGSVSIVITTSQPPCANKQRHPSYLGNHHMQTPLAYRTTCTHKADNDFCRHLANNNISMQRQTVGPQIDTQILLKRYLKSNPSYHACCRQDA